MNDDAIATKSDEIIRATSNGGRNEVVMLFSVISTPQRDLQRDLHGLVFRAAGRADGGALP